MARTGSGKLTSSEAKPARGILHPGRRSRFDLRVATALLLPILAVLPVICVVPTGTALPCLGVALLTLATARLGCAGAPSGARVPALDDEAHYRLLADNTTDMIAHLDLTGRRLFVSGGSRDLLGHEPADLVNTSMHGTIHPDDTPGLRAVFAGLAAGQMDRAVNVNRLRHKDGHWVWVEASLRLLRDPDGEPTGVVGVVRDITARRLADEALRRSDERYRLLADNTTDLISLESSLAGSRSYVSPSVYSITGHSAEAFLALPAADYIHPEDADRAATAFAALSPEHPDGKSLHRVRHKAGHWMWMETDFRLIEADGQDRTVLVRSRDVSVRHEAELALAASEARYRALAESTSDVITQLDLDLQRQYVSPSCRRVLGYEPGEMLDVRPSTRMHPDDVVEARSLATRLIAGEIEGDQAISTYRSLHKQGHWVWLETLLTLVRDGTGAPTSLICSLRDVTERQRVASHLERAKLDAEAAARAKAEFVANMSHELRTPLTGIIGVHDLLRADPGLTDAQRRMTDLASEAGRSLLAIVNDVLDFSKVDAGQLVLERVSFDIDKLLADCCDLIRGQIGGKALTVSLVREPASLGWFQGDPTRVRQILLNLLTNAAKFTHRGEIGVEARFRAETGLLRVSVADTGIGIPADQAGGLFDRFTQADTSTTRRYGGTGLGLAICKRLTELMGGRIGAEARAGTGSVFWFELPLDRSPDCSSAPGMELQAARSPTGCKLLLAEDNAVNAEIVAAMLAGRGYDVSVVADGVAAVKAAQADTARFDLILMDLQMPAMDGLSASAAIRSHEAQTGRMRLPIVGLTANALAEDVDLCRIAGMDAHVAKPIDWAKLFAVLEDLLAPRPTSMAKMDRREAAPVPDLARP